jgi:hypothetical protein
MNRSLFPEGVEVHQRHLANTESTKAAAISQLASDSTSLGVAQGLVVAVNTPDTTRIAVSSGYGYAPNGELLRLSGNVANLALASYTLGALNYVVLMYDETSSSPEAHESDGTTRNTMAAVTPRLVVLSATQYAAMASTDPVLSSNAKDRGLLLAVVTANGPSVSLTSGSIQSPTTFTQVLRVTQPVNISGVAIDSVDPLTNTGTGTLSFNSSTKVLTWQAPGDTVGANLTLAASQEYTVSSGSGRFLTVNVQFPLLPVTNQSDSISIANLYAQPVPRLTNDDLLHRSMVGTGTPTVKNPHGLTILDLDPGALNTVAQHQEVMHANGIGPGSASTLLQATVITATSPDQLQINGFVSGDSLYINGSEVQAVVGSPVVAFSDGIANQALYSVFITQSGTLTKQVRASFPPSGTTLLASKLQIVGVSHGIGSTTKNIVWTSAGRIAFDGGPSKAAPSTDQQMRLYAANNIDYVDVYVKGGSTPGSDQTDAIVFAVLPNLTQNFHVADVVWSGSATGFLGAGFGTSSAPNYVADRRLVGTFSPQNVRSDFGYNNSQSMAYEVWGDGVAPRLDLQTDAVTASSTQLSLGTASGGSVTLAGGAAYVGGRRFEIPSTVLTVTNSATNRIYIDHNGTPQISALTWQQISDTQLDKPFLKLWDLVMTGSSDTGHTDYRVYLGVKHDQPFGVVGLDGNTAVHITATSGDTITATAPAGGRAIVAIGTGASAAILATGGTGGALFGQGGGNGYGVFGQGAGTGVGIIGLGAGSTAGSTNGTLGGYFKAGADGDGLMAIAQGTGRSGVWGQGGSTGAGGDFTGGANGPGARARGTGNAHGLEATGAGSGSAIYASGGTWAGNFVGNVSVSGALNTSTFSASSSASVGGTLTTSYINASNTVTGTRTIISAASNNSDPRLICAWSGHYQVTIRPAAIKVPVNVSTGIHWVSPVDGSWTPGDIWLALNNTGHTVLCWAGQDSSGGNHIYFVSGAAS